MLYLSAGTKIRAFTLTECLGKGGMSAVWKARHSETEQDYALKILHGGVVDDEEARQRFFEEGLIQSRVAHPNVVAVKGRIEEHPIHALVMEYVEGPDLSEYVSERPSGLSLPEVKAITTGFLSGLNAAHRRGIVHRDVKPSNVLLARDFYTITPKLTDFGIAKVKYGRLKTVTSSPLGTPHFMSPEQLRDSKRVTIKTDLYSFGVTLYFMLTGTFPFDSEDLNALGLKIIQGGHQPPSYYREEIPPELEELIERCMAPRPQDRPENCREVLESVLAIDWHQPEAKAPKKPARKRPSPAQTAEKAATARLSPVRGPTPPPVPVAARAPSAPARRAPSPRPTGPVPTAVSGEWRMSGGLSDDAFDDDLTMQFRRRRRWPMVLGMLALVAATAAGTKLFLEYQASTATEMPAVTGSVEGGGAEALAAARPAAGTLPGTGDETPAAAAETGTEGSGLAALGTGQGAGSGEGSGADSALAAAEVEAPILGAEPGGEPLAAPGGSTATDLRLAMAEPGDSPVSGAVEPEPVAVVAAEAVAEAMPSETEAEPEPEADAEPESEEDDEVEEERESERSESERSSSRSGRSSSRSESGRLVGREAEAAAEEAWRARQGAGSDTRLAPTVHAAGPGDEPLGGGETADPTPAPTPPPAAGQEQLSPPQINRALAARNAQFRACYEGTDSEPIEMRIRILPEGRVSFARALDGGDVQVVGCLVREIGQLELDSFDGPAMNVRRTFSRVGPM